MADHVLKRFDEELVKLRYRLVRIGTLVQQQIDLAVTSVLDGNNHHAKLVLEIEDKVDQLDIKIDKQCLRIFALHQPVAMDLRLVFSAVSMNDDMELIGDLATNIAENVLKMEFDPSVISKTKFGEMNELLKFNISKVMDAFVNMDIPTALESMKSDSKINELFAENAVIITSLMKNDTKLIELCSHLIDINRNIQAISRQARNIAQEIIFLVKAKIVKHKSIAELVSTDFDAEFHSDDEN